MAADGARQMDIGAIVLVNSQTPNYADFPVSELYPFAYSRLRSFASAIFLISSIGIRL